MASVNQALKGLPWVDAASVKVSHPNQNAKVLVPDMSQFSEPELRQALAGREVVIQDVHKL